MSSFFIHEKITFGENLNTMKKIIYTFISLSLFVGSIFAQPCGNSGPSICVASGTMTQPGLTPRTDSLEPVFNGITDTTYIQFKNYNTVFYAPFGIFVTVQSLRIDSIENLPAGLCWATNKANNTYANQESGCIRVVGTPCAQPGQYKLRIWVFVNVGITSLLVDAATVGLNYFVRLGNYGDVVPACDTLQTASLYTVGYSPTANCSPVICMPFTFTQSSTGNTSCAAPIGSITVAASGGTSPYTYGISGSSNSTGTFTGLSGGNYTVTATDANSCTGTVTVSVSSTVPVVQVSSSSLTPQTSCTTPNGAITVSASGGTGPYTFTDGVSSNSSGIFDPLAAGSYTITATDVNSCSGIATEVITDNSPVVSTTVTTTPQTACVGSNGTFTATASGGGSPYTYTYSGGSNATGAFTGVADGSYTISVTDANGCGGTASATISSNVPTVTVSVSATNASTAVATDGTATATATGGNGAYTYAWTGTAQTTATVTGLAVGSYTVTVTDAGGCSATGSVTVSFNSGINSLVNELINVQIFPNPASDNFTVTAQLVNAKNVTVEIFNAIGEKVQSRNEGLTDRITENFSVKGLAKGTYTVKISTGVKSASYSIAIN